LIVFYKFLQRHDIAEILKFDEIKRKLLINWCLTLTLAVFQLYHGVVKIYKIQSNREIQFINLMI
jgi:hypothetical protein